MEIDVDNCIMHEDNYIITLTAVSYLHNDQTDGNLHSDQTDADLQMVICIMIILQYLNLHMGTFRVEIKVKIKMIQYVCIHNLIILHSTLPFRTDNTLEDRQ